MKSKILIKGLNISLLLLTISMNQSCTSTKILSASEVKMMTTKQYEESYDLVFKSAMSLLQSKQYTIESTDYDTGLIVATKNIYEKKKAHLTKGVIIVDNLNAELTEVKVTIYTGEEKIKRGYYGRENKRKTEQMNEDPALYKTWFTNLYAEIARRKALRE